MLESKIIEKAVAIKANLLAELEPVTGFKSLDFCIDPEGFIATYDIRFYGKPGDYSLGIDLQTGEIVWEGLREMLTTPALWRHLFFEAHSRLDVARRSS